MFERRLKIVFAAFILPAFLVAGSLRAQNVPYSVLFDDTLVNSIYITMDADSLEEMYDELVNDHDYSVQFVYADTEGNDTLLNVGFRLRGNTSLSSAKKSFKVSFNTYDAGRKYHGSEKLNLIGNHNDPTMSREKLYFDVYNDFGLPVRRVSFVKVFINDIYYGLYTSTEEYDEIFLKDRFGENTGNLFKCTYGANLSYEGASAGSYTGSYELQTNTEQNDYTDLIHLTDVLNNTPDDELLCELDKIFEINDFLKIYALDISAGHWDNYGFNQNNFYLYHNQFTDKFQFLSYDCDNTFGVDWFGNDWSDRNIYSWQNDNRPLVDKLMEFPECRYVFSYYLDQLVHGILEPENIFPHIDSIKELIMPAALADDFKEYDWGYTDDDFLNGFDTDDIDDHTPYGIKNFITLRDNSTLDQLETDDIIPIIYSLLLSPPLPKEGDSIKFTAQAEDDGAIVSAKLYMDLEYTGVYAIFDLHDDGISGDILADDNIFTFVLPPNYYSYDGPIDYYLNITDDAGHIARYPACAENEISFTVGYHPPMLVLNELLAKNDSVIADNAGDHADYIEIYNRSGNTIYLGDKYLSDEFSNPSKWRLPDVNLQGHSYFLIWADNETGEGDDHCDFKLSSDGEQLGLFAGVQDYFSVIDTITFGPQSADISFGRLPNGSGDFTLLDFPSPAANNDLPAPPGSVNASTLYIAGNPYTDASYIVLQLDKLSQIKLDIFSISGQLIQPLENSILQSGNYYFSIGTDQLQRGLYFIRLDNGGDISSLKFIVQ